MSRLSDDAKSLIREYAHVPGGHMQPGTFGWSIRGEGFVRSSLVMLGIEEAERASDVMWRWERMCWRKYWRDHARNQEARRIVAMANAWRPDAV